MGLKIADLLKWRDVVTLVNEDGKEIGEDGQPLEVDEEGNTKGEPLKVYLRIIGDDDLSASYRLARIASAAKRRSLEDKSSVDWEEASRPIMEAKAEECKVLIKQARTSNLEAEARAGVPRPDLPELEEFAADPDAATLAEQEQFEDAIEKVNEDYEKAVSDYMETRIKIIEDELSNYDLKKLRETALDEIGTILALGEFYAELFDQKTSRACYLDKTYKERAFDSVEEFKSASTVIKDQLINAYVALESRAGDVKN